MATLRYTDMAGMMGKLGRRGKVIESQDLWEHGMCTFLKFCYVCH